MIKWVSILIIQLSLNLLSSLLSDVGGYLDLENTRTMDWDLKV